MMSIDCVLPRKEVGDALFQDCIIDIYDCMQECNYVTLLYKQVMTRAQPPDPRATVLHACIDTIKLHAWILRECNYVTCYTMASCLTE